MGPAVALFSGMLMSSSSSSVSSSSSSTVAFVSLWFLVRLVLVNYGSMIGILVVAGREPGCWFGKGMGEVSGKEQGGGAGKEQWRV